MTDAATGTAAAAGATSATAAAIAGAAAGAAATRTAVTGDAKGGDGKTGAASTSTTAQTGDGKGATGADAAATAAAAAASGAGKDGKGADTGAANPWSADSWRGTWAAGDEKKLAWAARRGDIGAALESAYNADQKIADLTARAKAGPLAADATAEQIAQYRKDNGIPESIDGYLKDLPKEMALDDADKTALTPYLEAMHKLNLTPAQTRQLLEVRQSQLDKLVEAQGVQDNALKAQVEDQLRGEWGNDYRPNLNAIHDLLNGFPEDAREVLLSARGADGKALFNNKQVLQAFAQIARTANPFGTIVGGDGGSLDAKGVEGRMAEIKAMMGAPEGSEQYKGYWGNPGVQKEYRELIEAQQRMKVRTAA